MESLAEVGVVLLEIDAVGDLEEAEDADGGVDREAPDRRSGIAEIALQQVVHRDHRFAEIFEEVAAHRADRLRHDETIDLRDRHHDPGVEEVVEAEHEPVEPFEGVAAGVRVGELFRDLVGFARSGARQGSSRHRGRRRGCERRLEGGERRRQVRRDLLAELGRRGVGGRGDIGGVGGIARDRVDDGLGDERGRDLPVHRVGDARHVRIAGKLQDLLLLRHFGTPGAGGLFDPGADVRRHRRGCGRNSGDGRKKNQCGGAGDYRCEREHAAAFMVVGPRDGVSARYRTLCLTRTRASAHSACFREK